MPSTMEQRRLGLKKEAVRGTAETTPDKFRAVSADTELAYSLALIDDETKRGINAKFPAAPGVKDGEGTIKFPVRPSEMGEFLQMALGDPVTSNPGTLAFLHTFDAPLAASLNQRPAYTLFLDRGLNIKKYNLGSVDVLAINQDPDGLMQMEASMMFKSEVAGAIGSPDYSGESQEGEPDQITHKIDTVLQTEIRQFSYEINQQLFKKRTQAQSKDIADIITVGPLMLTGSFEIFFEDEAERVKFLAGTQFELDHDLTGELIEAGQNYEMKLNVPTAKYRALPIGDLDGILGATAEWEAEFDTVTSKLFSIALKNKTVSY
ncbi:MAG: phage tail tube protein [Nitrososphaerales archaeon]